MYGSVSFILEWNGLKFALSSDTFPNKWWYDGPFELAVDYVSSASGKVRVVYIGGSSRSGTGILGRVFSRIDGAAHGGELRRLWSRGLRPGKTCDCGRPHSECPIWSELLVPGASYIEPSIAELSHVQAAAAPESHAWLHALRILRRRSPPAASSAAARYVELYSDLYQAFARSAGSSIVMDNSKNPADAALFVDAPGIEAYCVQIVRDPRGVLFSARKRSSPDDPGRFRPLETTKVAVYWMLRQMTFNALRRRYGDERSLVVIYERLMENPNLALADACSMLGEPEPAGDLQSGVPFRVPEVHGPDGSSVQRFVTTEVVLRVDDRWIGDLHPADRALMTFLTYPLLRRYGYPIRAGSSQRRDK